jgi:hypothetical protein
VQVDGMAHLRLPLGRELIVIRRQHPHDVRRDPARQDERDLHRVARVQHLDLHGFSEAANGELGG